MTNTTKKKNTTLFSIIIILLVIALGITIFFTSQKNKADVNNEEEIDYHSLEYKGKNYTYNPSIVSILLLGIDSNEQDKIGQADAIEMLLLDRKSKQIKVISIPRDTMTEIRMFDVEGNDLGWERQHINLAYAYADNPESGCMYTSQAVSRLFNGIPMTRYASLHLNMLPEVHNIVGTLEVEVPNDSLLDSSLGLAKGDVVELTSSNIETYLRTRDVEVDFSNVTRMERQKSYLIAYFNKLKDLLNKDFDNTVTRMYNILHKITTNISLSDMEEFAKMIVEYEFNPSDSFYTIDGEDIVGTLHDEFEVDQDLLMERIVKLFYEED